MLAEETKNMSSHGFEKRLEKLANFSKQEGVRVRVNNG